MKAAVLVFVALFSLAVVAADPPTTEIPKGQQEWMKYGTPGAGHKVLNDVAGNFKFTMKWWMNPTAKAEESKGTSKSKWIMGGRFLQQDVKSKSMGQPFTGMGLVGFDILGEKYQTTWIDNMSTHLLTGSGTYDVATKTLSQTGTMSCAMTGDKNRWYRTELNIVDKNTHTYAMFVKDTDGKEFKSMEINYTRTGQSE